MQAFVLITHSVHCRVSPPSLPPSGQPTLTLYTDPPTNGSVHFFCGSNGAKSNLTITCNYSASLITPDVVINGERYSVGELSELYTLVNTTESAVVIRVLLSSAQNRFNFSCVMSETLATRTITFEEGKQTEQCKS